MSIREQTERVQHGLLLSVSALAVAREASRWSFWACASATIRAIAVLSAAVSICATHRALKILAAERGTTISELVRDAVSQVYGEEIEERTGRR
ncbi:hypothetical protein [Actinomyces trachealis]|uniref:hypothetical protein n=1 Tax=Actinomyces trachealis TaxID=2763540 RepID=UPI00189297D3|nr:hypothetical protein [Actinomyces trachealis]